MKRSTVPGPKGHWLFGNTLDFTRAPNEFMERIAREYGGVVYAPFLGMNHYHVSDPKLIEQVLVHQHRKFKKDPLTYKVREVMGDGLVTSDGDSWKRQRKLAAPVFSRTHVDGYAKIMTAHSGRYVEGLRVGEERDVAHDMHSMSLKISAEVMFSYAMDDQVDEIRRTLDMAHVYFTHYMAGWKQILPDFIPTPMRRRFRATMRRFDAQLYAMIDERRARPTADLLSRMISAADDEVAPLDDRQVRDELITFLIAGHETTAMTLTCALYVASGSPEIEAALAEEATRVLGDEPASAAAFPSLTYTTAVIKEVLRLYPSGWILGREALEECQLGEHTLPKGAYVTLSPWVVQRDPRWFEEPLVFKVERWLGDLEKTLPRFAYFPFGGGPRTCIGSHFAMLSMVLGLATIYRRVRFERTRATTLRLMAGANLRTEVPLMLRVQAAAARELPASVPVMDPQPRDQQLGLH